MAQHHEQVDEPEDEVINNDPLGVSPFTIRETSPIKGVEHHK
jgi:hypothetical protein